MENSEYKLELARIKANKQIELKRLGTAKSRYSKTLTPIQPAPLLSKEQDMMNDLFGGREENRVMFGTASGALPKMNGALMEDNFNDFDDGETTRNLFGGGVNRSTGSMFGI